MSSTSTKPRDRPPASTSVSGRVEPSPRPSRSDRIILGVLAVAQAAYVFIIASVGYFNMDDLHNFAIAQREGLSWRFLNRDLLSYRLLGQDVATGHWAPGGHFLIWLVNATSRLNWSFALAVGVLFAVVSLLFLDRILRTLNIPRWLRFGLLVVFVFSPFVVRPATWFASSIESLPGVAFTLVSVDGFLRYRTTRRNRYWFECVIGCAASLLFWPFPLFLVACLALLTLVLTSSTLSGRVIVDELRSLWPIWAALIVLDALYLLIYETYIAVPALSPTVANWFQFIWLAWAHAFVPASLGLVLPSGAIRSVTFTVLATQVLFAAMVIFTVWRDRRAWALFGFVFIMTEGLVGWTRGGFPGAGVLEIVATDLKYQTQVLAFLLLAVALAIYPRVKPSARARPTSPVAVRPATGTRSRLLDQYLPVLLFAVFMCIYVPVAVGSGSWLADNSPGVDPAQSGLGTAVEAVKPFLSHTRSDLARLHARNRTVALYDEPLPIVWSVLFPYDLSSRIVPQVSPSVAFDGAHQPEFVVDPRTGHVHAAGFDVQRVALLKSSAAGTSGSTGSEQCLVAGTSPASLVAPLDAPLEAGYWFARVRLSSGGATRLRLLVDDGRRAYDAQDPPGFPDGEPGYFAVPAHTRSYVVGFLAVGPIQSVRLVVQPRQSVCIEGIDLGSPVAR